MEPIRLTLGPAAPPIRIFLMRERNLAMSYTGTVTIHIGNKSYKAKEGETFYLIPNKSHYLENPGKTRAPSSLDQLSAELLDQPL